MSLIVTQVSNYGIVMIGDSAETNITKNNSKYIRIGVNKVIQVHKKFGISFWGDGKINKLPMDFFLEDLINEKINSDIKLYELANLICNTINNNKNFFDTEKICGFHIAGYEKFNDRFLPSIYHVHNHNNKKSHKHKLKVYHDFPNGVYNNNLKNFFIDFDKEKIDWHLRNGSYELFAILWDYIAPKSNISKHNKILSILDYMKKIDKNFDCPEKKNIDSYANFYSFLVEIVIKLIDLSNKLETISGPLTVLTINKNGIVKYSKALKKANDFYYTLNDV